MKRALAAAFLFFLGPMPGAAAHPPALPASPPAYAFRIERDFIPMRDGVRLAATFFRPVGKPGERFPVLLELLPYRKDDSFYMRDYPLYAYFARRGYAMAKVDVRGTGASEGAVPPREYSDEELADAVEVIDRLSKARFSNGRVGMWGISWGGFNALQVAMRRPPALKAILAAHASDDLFHDDVHYIDGCFHVDEYELSIDHENALPRPPGYALDEAYFRERFEATPWLLTYLEHQADSAFWRSHSLRWSYDAITVPTYLIGGLLDGYRDTVPRLLENLKAPVRAEIGPWNHAWPDSGEPGPNYEWRNEATRWWDYWLKGRDTGILKEPRFAVFVRAGHGPDPHLNLTPGRWRYEDWPISRAERRRFHLAQGHRLLPQPGDPEVEALRYVPSYGAAAGQWWGEVTGDMRPDDAGSLVFDSAPLGEAVEIVGFPRVALRASLDAPLAHWMARLEDVQPDGTVALVTGAALNGSQRRSRLEPEAFAAGQVEEIAFDLHFTTWTFRPGHRIRLAVTNAQFPMIWPTPYAMTTRLHLGGEGAFLELPVIPTEARPTPTFPPPEPREQRPDARDLGGVSWPAGQLVTRAVDEETASLDWRGESHYEIGDRRYDTSERTLYTAAGLRPAEAGFRGEAAHRIALAGRTLELRTLIDLRSDATAFRVTFTRRVFENASLVREKQWTRTIARQFQ